MAAVSDSDAAHGEGSGFLYPADADFPAGTDAGEALRPRDLDASGRAADLELTAWPGDADGAGTRLGAGEGQYWSGPLADADSSRAAADGPAPVVFRTAGAEAAVGTDGHVVEVYAYQPPFRWTGGYFSLAVLAPPARDEKVDEVRELILWRGERPDGTALRLHAAFAAGRLHFLSGSDAAACREEEEAASLQVTVHVAPALGVALAVS